MSNRTRSPTRQRYDEPRPKPASIPKSNCKTKTGIVSMEECIKDVIENKTKYFIIIYRDSTGEYGNVLELEDLKIFLRKYDIAAYINLWKGDDIPIPFYFTKWIIHYINRHEKDKEKFNIPNILIVEKKSSWLSWIGWSDYFDIHFADYDNGDVIPIKDPKRIVHINYTEDDKMRGKERYEFVPKERVEPTPTPTPRPPPIHPRNVIVPAAYPYYPKQIPTSMIPFSSELDIGKRGNLANKTFLGI